MCLHILAASPTVQPSQRRNHTTSGASACLGMSLLWPALPYNPDNNDKIKQSDASACLYIPLRPALPHKLNDDRSKETVQAHVSAFPCGQPLLTTLQPSRRQNHKSDASACLYMSLQPALPCNPKIGRTKQVMQAHVSVCMRVPTAASPTAQPVQ